MRRISTKTHGIVDYATGAMLLAAPGLLGARDPRTRVILRGVGATMVGQAMVTDWELAVVRRLPVRAHLAADATTGATLLASPWLLGLRSRGPGAWAPSLLVGLIETGAAAMTDPSGSQGSSDAGSGAGSAGASGDGGASGAGQGPSTTTGAPNALRTASIPGTPDQQPDQVPGGLATPEGDAPSADQVEGLRPFDAPAPLDAPGPSVNAPATTEGSTVEREERIDATVPDSEALGVAGRDPVEQLIAREEAAAAAEAAQIGGEPTARASGDADIDPAAQPVYEAGGGEQEGFEMAEDDLIANATHDDGGGNPLRDAIAPEAESDRSTAEYGEPDDEPATDRAARDEPD